MNPKQASNLVSGSHSGLEATYFKLWMPYVYVRLQNAKRSNVYLPLNRNYKPLGTLNREWVDYEGFAVSHGLVFHRAPSTFKDIWWNQRDDHFWLYDDSPESRFDYFARLERLILKNPVMLSKKYG